MTRVMLIIPTASYRAPDFLEAAARLGLDVVVASEQEQILAGMFDGKALTVSFSDESASAEAVAKFADAYPLDAVIAVDDAGTTLAARSSELLRLPSSTLDAVQATRNKAILRRRLAAAGLPSPHFRLCSFDDDPAAVAAELAADDGFPCVLKPLALSGSRGVIRANDPASFVAAQRRLHAILSQPDVAAECGDTAGQYLVEGYIPGAEVSLEGLITGGMLHTLAIFDKPDPLVGPYFEETIYVTPSRLPLDTQHALSAMAQRAAHALGIADGPLHVEMRFNEDGIWPIDIAARTIGGYCARTLQFGGSNSGGSHSGSSDGEATSLEEMVLRHATGAPIDSFDRESQASGVMMIPIPSAGTLRAVHGVDAARAVHGIDDVITSIPVGRTLVPLPEGAQYLGFIFAKADRPEQVEAALRAAHARLRFDIEAIDDDSEGTGGQTQ